jgi:hypothetical protein
MKIHFLKIRLIQKQLRELNIHYLLGSNIILQTQTWLRTNFWMEDVILTVDTATMIRLIYGPTQ